MSVVGVDFFQVHLKLLPEWMSWKLGGVWPYDLHLWAYDLQVEHMIYFFEFIILFVSFCRKKYFLCFPNIWAFDLHFWVDDLHTPPFCRTEFFLLSAFWANVIALWSTMGFAIFLFSLHVCCSLLFSFLLLLLSCLVLFSLISFLSFVFALLSHSSVDLNSRMAFNKRKQGRQINKDK